jgi:hypothetical protein
MWDSWLIPLCICICNNLKQGIWFGRLCSYLRWLRHLDIGPVWCNILSKLLRSSSTRVIVNGESGELICHQRGLWQGDLLSPMLMHFLLVTDVLNSLITKASETRLLQPLLRWDGSRVSLTMWCCNRLLGIWSGPRKF